MPCRYRGWIEMTGQLRIMAINGSPRKNGSTAKLLEAFLKGASEMGAETEMVNLYELEFTGCRECYLCKIKNGKRYGECAYRDGLTDVIAKVRDCDGFAFGAPIFLGDFAAQGKSFLERLFFPYTSYEGGDFSLNKNPKPTALFAAMNVKEDFLNEFYRGQLGNTEAWFKRIMLKDPYTLYSTDTYQFSDYSRYDAGLWNEPEKRAWRDEHFPIDLQKAEEIGKKVCEDASKKE